MIEGLDHIKNIIFLDIETISAHEDYTSLTDRQKALWDKKSQNIKSETAITAAEKYFEKAAIYAEFAKVFCIAVGLFIEKNDKLSFHTKCYYGDELDVLNSFADMLSKNQNSNKVLCAHNGYEFDYPFLCRRFLINGLQIPKTLDVRGLKPWEVKHLDTMELWKFGDKKAYTSLEALATVFDVPSSKDGIDGARVNEFYYKKKDTKSIAKYCERDVYVLAQIYCRINGLHHIKADEVVYSVI
jgi:predicted PolB exonuclease-like 3'-5' exonuclease